jgi:hypothetical protein
VIVKNGISVIRLVKEFAWIALAKGRNKEYED